PVVARRPLRADERRFGPAEAPPHRDSPDRVAGAVDLPEEVVRGEEHQVAAEVAVALDDVVDVPGHVLLVAREDDEVVRAAQLVAALDALEVVVREEVDLLAGPAQPRNEAQVPVVEAEGHAEVEERPREVDGRARPADVPAVAPTVAVGVEEVV